MALSGPFVLKPKSLGQPGLDGVGAVLSFPLFQSLVVAAFRLYDLAGVGVLVDLHLAWLAGARLGLSCWSATYPKTPTAPAHVISGYYWLAATWPNLLLSCADCNRPRTQDDCDGNARVIGKANFFPLVDETKRANAGT